MRPIHSHALLRISPSFITYAVSVLGSTENGLSGPQIVQITSAHAANHGVNIPHPHYPFEASNKRTALAENILAFAPEQQYAIIKELCDHPRIQELNAARAREVKLKLITQYAGLDTSDGKTDLNETLVEQTRHWLDGFPPSLSLYNEALQKYQHGVFQRNVLDDLRLALEALLKAVFNNEKSLENQIPGLGELIKSRGGSKHLSNMFSKLVDYYSKYQNQYVKHNDAVIEEEVEFVFEITSSFMKHVVRLSERRAI